MRKSVRDSEKVGVCVCVSISIRLCRLPSMWMVMSKVLQMSDAWHYYGTYIGKPVD